MMMIPSFVPGETSPRCYEQESRPGSFCREGIVFELLPLQPVVNVILHLLVVSATQRTRTEFDNVFHILLWRDRRRS